MNLQPLRRRFPADRADWINDEDPAVCSEADAEQTLHGKVACTSSPACDQYVDDVRRYKETGRISLQWYCSCLAVSFRQQSSCASMHDIPTFFYDVLVPKEAALASNDVTAACGRSPSLEDDILICNAPGCRAVSHTIKEYEAHYQAAHKFACHECYRSFPNEKLMDLHITERHDPFFQVQSEREPMYKCLVEGCESVFKAERARHLHLTDKHRFPRDFDYDGMGRLERVEDPKRDPTQKEKVRRQRQGKGEATEFMVEAEGEHEMQTDEGQDRLHEGPSHAESHKTPRCVYFNAAGGCKRGDACKFKHGPKRRASKEEAMDMDMDALGEAMEGRLKLVPREVTFGRHARGRSRKLEKPHYSGDGRSGQRDGMLEEKMSVDVGPQASMGRPGE